MALCRLVPIPRALALGGRDFLVSEFRLRDVATLEAWAESKVAYPLDGLPARGSVPDAEWARAFALAYDAAEAWPPRYGSPKASRLFATDRGLAFFVWVALVRHEPGLTLDRAGDVGRAMTADDWRLLCRAAFGPDPLAELDAMVDEGAAGPPAPIRWPEEVHRVAEALGVPYREVYDMTLTEFFSALRAGKPRDHGLDVSDLDDAAIEALAARRRALFGGGHSNGQDPV